VSTFFAVVGLAIIDSINPSALLATVHLLSRPRYHRTVPVYVATIFVTYLVLGVGLMAGITAIRDALEGAAQSRLGSIVQASIGAGLIIYAVRPHAVSKRPQTRKPRSYALRAVALLALTVTVLELPTAFPYFAAIGILNRSEIGILEWVPILAIYCGIFVAPPLLLLAGTILLRERFTSRVHRVRDWLQRQAGGAWPWLLGIAGVYLLVDGLDRLGVFGP
jgi:cytochrome c biogenesis protein CcdA